MGSTWLLLVAVLVSAVADADRYHPEGGRASSTGPRAGENVASYWYREAQEAITVRERRGSASRMPAGGARNVVMFLGDGMSVPTLAAARTLLGQRAGSPGGEEAQLSFEAFPTVGLAKTYCLNEQVPDSACTATAYLCGVKANRGTLGVTGAVPRRDCVASAAEGARVLSIAEWALADGRDAGIVTTTRVTHASPSGAFAKAADRNWENDAEVAAAGADLALCPDIAHQLVHMEPGNRFKVILGGGRREFRSNETLDEEGTRGQRTDARDLIQEWRDDKLQRNLSHAYVWHAAQLRELALDPPDYLLGLFEGTHLQYHLEADLAAEPTLAELTEVAIRSLSRNERGFFLFVEGGRIDHAHHDNYAHLALDETIELSAAVERAAALLSEQDSLLVVTADHTHVMSFNGYSPRGHDILGTSSNVDEDGVSYLTLSYANGPGGIDAARKHTNGIRPDVTQEENFRALRWRTHVDVPLDSETHGGDDVAVFAYGVAHEMFSGLYEQSQVPHLMAYAACMGPGERAPSCAAPVTGAAGAPRACLPAALLMLLLTFMSILVPTLHDCGA